MVWVGVVSVITLFVLLFLGVIYRYGSLYMLLIIYLEVFTRVRFGFYIDSFCLLVIKKRRRRMKEEQSRTLFGISLSDRPTWQQFLICTSGFFFGYLVNGVCEVLFLPFFKVYFSVLILLLKIPKYNRLIT